EVRRVGARRIPAERVAHDAGDRWAAAALHLAGHAYGQRPEQDEEQQSSGQGEAWRGGGRALGHGRCPFGEGLSIYTSHLLVSLARASTVGTERTLAQEVEPERSAVTAGAAGTGRRPTSADVAREAGVSRATVSYVLNDAPHQKIPAATRERVLAAAARLGYAPSAAARALRSGRSDVVLCLLPDWPIGPEVGSMLGNLSTALARHGLTLVAHPGNREDRPITEIWKAITPAVVIAFADFSEGEVAA